MLLPDDIKFMDENVQAVVLIPSQKARFLTTQCFLLVPGSRMCQTVLSGAKAGEIKVRQGDYGCLGGILLRLPLHNPMCNPAFEN